MTISEAQDKYRDLTNQEKGMVMATEYIDGSIGCVATMLSMPHIDIGPELRFYPDGRIEERQWVPWIAPVLDGERVAG